MDEKILESLESINKKLTVLVSSYIEDENKTIKEQVIYLSKFNLTYNEIAEILGITKSHAAKELSKIKKKEVKNEH